MKLFEKWCYFEKNKIKSRFKWNNSSLMAELAKNKYKSIGWHVTQHPKLMEGVF